MLDRKIFKNKIIKSSFWLCLVVLFSFSIITFSKYVSGVYGSDNGRVAKYSIFDNIESIPINLGKLDNTDNSVTYDFIITNKDENNKKTETLYKYKIKINTMKNIPINIELYKNGDIINILNDNLETDYMNMALDSLQEDSFSLKISLNNESNYLNSDLIDYLDIEILSEQID